MTPRFRDRKEAGSCLAERLQHLASETPLVLGLARGGVVLASVIAKAMDAELEVLVVRKVGAPFQPEFGVGAVAPGGVRVYDPVVLNSISLSMQDFEKLARTEMDEVDRRVRVYRRGRPPMDVSGRTAILVDDGLATGVTALAAVRYLRQQYPRKIVLAAPVCARQSYEALKGEVDEIVCLHNPDNFNAVGEWYERFDQVEDVEILQLLSDVTQEKKR